MRTLSHPGISTIAFCASSGVKISIRRRLLAVVPIVQRHPAAPERFEAVAPPRVGGHPFNPYEKSHTSPAIKGFCSLKFRKANPARTATSRAATTPHRTRRSSSPSDSDETSPAPGSAAKHFAHAPCHNRHQQAKATTATSNKNKRAAAATVAATAAATEKEEETNRRTSEEAQTAGVRPKDEERRALLPGNNYQATTNTTDQETRKADKSRPCRQNNGWAAANRPIRSHDRCGRNHRHGPANRARPDPMAPHVPDCAAYHRNCPRQRGVELIFTAHTQSTGHEDTETRSSL